MPDEEPQDPQPCMACHGTGQVVSNLGGERRKITCPWCRGSGTRIPGADAQEHRRTLTGTPHSGAQAGEAGEQGGAGGAGGPPGGSGGGGEAA